MPAVASMSGRLHSEFVRFLKNLERFFQLKDFSDISDMSIYLLWSSLTEGALPLFFHPEEHVTLWCVYMLREKKNGSHDNGDDKSV
jgi:hypothetical protein